MKRVALPGVLCLCLAGCADPKGDALSLLDRLRADAQGIAGRSSQIDGALSEPAPDVPAAKALNAENGQAAERIVAGAGQATKSVAQTDNPKSEWQQTLRVAAYAVIGMCGVFALIYFARVLRPALALVGLAIPKAAREDAKFGAEALAADDPKPVVQQWVAAQRARPYHAAAWKRAKPKGEQ